MFKVYYKDELVSEQEFRTTTEAKKAIVPMLAGQKGITQETLLNETENGIKTLQIRGTYESKKKPQVARVCPICGKTFYVASEKSLKKLCSDECRKKYLRKYNTKYCKDRYKGDEEKHQKALASNRASSKRNVAKKRWERRLAFADVIIKLAQMPNARDTIATYLDKKVIAQGARGITNREFRCEGEVKAEKIFYDTMFEIVDSLGDLTDD